MSKIMTIGADKLDKSSVHLSVSEITEYKAYFAAKKQIRATLQKLPLGPNESNSRLSDKKVNTMVVVGCLHTYRKKLPVDCVHFKTP